MKREGGCDLNEDVKLGTEDDNAPDWGDQDQGDQDQDMPGADEPTSEGNDADDIRNLLRSRPQSLVLLTAHRMIGIFGQIGEYNTFDTAETIHNHQGRLGSGPKVKMTKHLRPVEERIIKVTL